MVRAGLHRVMKRVRHVVHVSLHEAVHRVLHLPGVVLDPEAVALQTSVSGGHSNHRQQQ